MLVCRRVLHLKASRWVSRATCSIGFALRGIKSFSSHPSPTVAEATALNGRYTDARRRYRGTSPALTASHDAQGARATVKSACLGVRTPTLPAATLSEAEGHDGVQTAAADTVTALVATPRNEAGVTLDRRTRLIYSRTALGINGEWIERRSAILAFKTLASQREDSAAP